ncbi:hypothetical protein Forpe1208_v016621 [Fusarium oxysporum f. sp. rapae]|uniref:Uncharacterized protein n=1 Tax=Fusarium oxysporum f. sp. rapae TaxID=485398 RepID=A0A8J5TMT9_FUSOX|nr:hypothetical protein Forpe1208_v016621 [Fusarium oxysporum f. sp. rapae]
MATSSTININDDRNNQGLPSAPATVNADSVIGTQATPKPKVIGLYGISGSGKFFAGISATETQSGRIRPF